MSLSKRLCLENDSLKRQSFDERICDDLSEVILQYLSLEDKLRLECVSKQFQRTVFQRQYELKLTEERCYTNSNGETKYIDNYFLMKDKGIDLKCFESLLKKCPNLRSIELYYYDFEFKNYNQFIRLITRYCDNLVEFKLPLNMISVTAFKAFQKKFCKQIKYFSEIQNNKDLNRMNLFPNVEKLVFGIYYQYSSTKEWTISGLKFKNLKTLEVQTFKRYIDKSFAFNFNENTNLIKTLFKTFGTINRLNLKLHFDGDSFQEVQKLKNLTHLSLTTHSCLQSNLFFKEFKQIGDQCLNLKSIECTLDVNSENITNISDLFSPFKAFPKLKHLRIIFDFNVGHEFQDEMGDQILFEGFKGLSNITHLCLKSKQLNGFDVTLLKDIDIYLPKLQYLKIGNPFIIGSNGVKLMADILSPLSRLQTIKLKFESDFDYSELRLRIGEKCRKIRRIDFKQKDFE